MIKKPFGCGLGPALDLIGGRWKATILWELSQGAMRFGELRRNIEGITEKMLTQQLRELEEHGLILRNEYRGKTLRVEYALSDEGVKINSLTTTLGEWGRDYARKINILDKYTDVY